MNLINYVDIYVTLLAEKRNGVLTDLEAILKEASIVSFPFNKFNPLALNLITLNALPSI